MAMDWRLLTTAAVVLTTAALMGGGAEAAGGVSNLIEGSSRGVATGDELVAHVVDTCFDGHESMMRCVRKHALSYLDTLAETEPSTPELVAEGEGARSDDRQDEALDRMIFERTQRYLGTHQLRVQLPETVFQEAQLVVKGDGTVDLAFPPKRDGESRAYAEARDMMQNKMLLPILLLLKLKLKALTPILVALVGMKALKALILSKISILLVVGFLAAQLFKKAGMMPMMPAMTVEPMSPPPMPMSAYGPPTPSYGPPTPAAAPPPVTQSSYEPSWEPGGPYQRWDTAQHTAYAAYAPPSQQQPQVAHQQQPQTSSHNQHA